MTTPDHLAVTIVSVDWDTERTSDGNLDLDLTAFVLDANGTVISDDYFVFFNNQSTPEQSVRLTGGSDDVKSETLVIDTGTLPAAAKTVVIAVSVYDQLAPFGRFADARIVVDDSGCGKLAEYSLSDSAPDAVGMVYAELKAENGKWRFIATGTTQSGLASMTEMYGIKT